MAVALKQAARVVAFRGGARARAIQRIARLTRENAAF